MYQAAVQTETDVVGCELQVLVVDLTASIEMCTGVGVVKCDGVLGRIAYRFLQARLASVRGIVLQRISFRGIGQDGVCSQGNAVGGWMVYCWPTTG